MKSHYVSDLQDGQAVTALFLVGEKEIRTSQRTGKSWLELALRDRTGSIPAKMWDNFEALAKTFEARRRGPDSRPRETLQRAEGNDARADCSGGGARLRSCRFSRAHEVRRREALCRAAAARSPAVKNPWIKRLLENVVNDPAIAPKLKRAPAAMTMHHAFVGGLLEHIVSLIGLGRAVAAHYPELDADLLLAGIVLHDIGKIDELSYERGDEYTTAGTPARSHHDRDFAGARKNQGDSRFSGAARDFDRAFDFEPSRHLRIWLAFVAADARSGCAAFSGRHGFEDGGDARDAGRRIRQPKTGPIAIRRCGERCCAPTSF